MKYIYKLEKNEYYENNNFNQFNNKWLFIGQNKIIVKKEYAWNGCSPKFDFLNLMFGTPEGKYIEYNKPITWRGSLLHDCLYQFKGQHNISRKQADILFYDELKENGFIFAKVYYLAVLVFGGFFGSWNNKK